MGFTWSSARVTTRPIPSSSTSCMLIRHDSDPLLSSSTKQRKILNNRCLFLMNEAIAYEDLITKELVNE